MIPFRLIIDNADNIVSPHSFCMVILVYIRHSFHLLLQSGDLCLLPVKDVEALVKGEGG